ncbi:50S ribosomal protein L1 [bacterium HR17]|jgi:large subunit ribosomal protein L1|uniref:Large ribosomal subunit protein uL1 n=1 Tax=Candidatus Fervidibacter japonicus TaxID=2035412 RepID=A0A2H5XAS3_9BACT|nr:50S ribosomal protein L1 [bacterium HR17]
MAKRGKRYRQLLELYDRQAEYSVADALELIKKLATAKFDESVDVALVLGIDPRKSDQRVRGVVQLPHGTGRQPVVAVIAKGEKVREAEEAGADFVGAEDLIDRIDKGWKDFDYLLATPDMMRLVSRLGRKLGPLMPNPRTGTVTNEIGEVVRQLKSGRLDFRSDPQGVVHTVIGKVSFPTAHLLDNFKALLDAVMKARPATQRGQYIRSIYLSPTMGPSVKVSVQDALQLVR